MLSEAIAAAREAGAYMKPFAGRPSHVEQKDGQETNLVTEVDKHAESIIIGRLKHAFPDHDFLAEESGDHQGNSPYKWVIDPLDGTVNFTHGLPIFCVSIGLEYNGEVILGVVYDPNMNELFTAEKGKGALLNGEPIHVSRTKGLRESLVVTGFPYDIKDNPDHAIEHFTNFLTEARAVRRLGSAALDLCYVAAGRFDGFWEVKLNAWDMAAGVLLVQEAGGRWTDFEGKPSSIYTRKMLSTNGRIHEQMVEVLGRRK
jgi:myo-inositol-1(or 4)-monophosphatase